MNAVIDGYTCFHKFQFILIFLPSVFSHFDHCPSLAWHPLSPFLARNASWRACSAHTRPPSCVSSNGGLCSCWPPLPRSKRELEGHFCQPPPPSHVLTAEKAGGKPWVLIVDGHSSHYMAEFIHYAWKNNIIVLRYPPHCTHALQGLDVVCFTKMKDKWKKEITAHEETTLKPVGKSDFLGVFGCTYNAAFTPDTVKAAFKVTGVVPFNRNAISEDQMKPSIATSVKGSFPLPQPEVVCTVMAAIDKNPPTSF